MTHPQYIKGLVSQLGSISVLKSLRYDMLDGNWHRLSKQYGINLYDLRYIDSQYKEIERYIHESENKQELRLVYANVA